MSKFDTSYRIFFPLHPRHPRTFLFCWYIPHDLCSMYLLSKYSIQLKLIWFSNTKYLSNVVLRVFAHRNHRDVYSPSKCRTFNLAYRMCFAFHLLASSYALSWYWTKRSNASKQYHIDLIVRLSVLWSNSTIVWYVITSGAHLQQAPSSLTFTTVMYIAIELWHFWSVVSNAFCRPPLVTPEAGIGMFDVDLILDEKFKVPVQRRL